MNERQIKRLETLKEVAGVIKSKFRLESSENIITTNDICEQYFVSISTVSLWRTLGMPHFREGKKFYYEEDEVYSWLEMTDNGKKIMHEERILFDGQNKVVSTAELCNHYKVDHCRVGYWRRLGMPYTKEGPKTFRYETAKVAEWLNGPGRKQYEKLGWWV